MTWVPTTDSSNAIKIDVFQAPGQYTPFGNMRVGTTPSGYTGSTRALSHAMELISECSSSHKLCGNSSLKPLPTRVLDLGTDESSVEAKVHITENDDRAQYATLSHCWGRRGNRRILTNVTLESWLNPFPISDLPLTYRDAITVAKRLGMRYLWIDSLCIIQDDEEDWKRESSKMAGIFQNLFITIAATCAADSSSGMFRIARPIHKPRAITYSYGRINSQLCAYQSLSHHNSATGSFDCWDVQHATDLPLLSRAWVYQERLLSPRILHFTNEELIFECMESKRCECGILPTARRSVKEKHAKSLDKTIQRIGGREPTVDRWHTIAREYTLLNMTCERDKLPAVSGVASQMESCTNDKYFAGLWHASFLEDLCWTSSRSSSKPSLQSWRAPSWSWAAAREAVNYNLTHDMAPLLMFTRSSVTPPGPIDWES